MKNILVIAALLFTIIAGVANAGTYEDLQEKAGSAEFQEYLATVAQDVRATSYNIMQWSFGDNYNNGSGDPCFTCGILLDILGALSTMGVKGFLFFAAIFFALFGSLLKFGVITTSALAYFHQAPFSQYIKNLSLQIAAFTFAAIVFSVGAFTVNTTGSTYSSTNTPGSYNFFIEGPALYGTELASALQNSIVSAHSEQQGVSTGFNCEKAYNTSRYSTDKYPELVIKVVAQYCTIERALVTPVIVSIAIAEGAMTALVASLNPLTMIPRLITFFTAIILAAILFIQAIIAGWFLMGKYIGLFMRLIVVAIFSPVLLLMGLFKPTRGMSGRAVSNVMNVIGNLIGLGLYSGVIIILLSAIPEVYNAELAIYKEMGATYYKDFKPIVSEPFSLDALREFVVRHGVDPSDDAHIETKLTSVWFFYMLLIAAMTKPLGMQLISQIEEWTGAVDTSNVGQAMSGLVTTAMSAPVKALAAGAVAKQALGRIAAKGTSGGGGK